MEWANVETAMTYTLFAGVIVDQEEEDKIMFMLCFVQVWTGPRSGQDPLPRGPNGRSGQDPLPRGQM